MALDIKAGEVWERAGSPHRHEFFEAKERTEWLVPFPCRLAAVYARDGVKIRSIYAGTHPVMTAHGWSWTEEEVRMLPGMYLVVECEGEGLIEVHTVRLREGSVTR